MTDLGTLGGTDSSATAINDRGEIVGYSTTATSDRHAFLWRRGEMIDLGTLGGIDSFAVAINNRGQVVGRSDSVMAYPDTSYWRSHAFLWQDGQMTDLGTLGGRNSGAEGINDVGQIVGYSFSAAQRNRPARALSGPVLAIVLLYPMWSAARQADHISS